MLSSIDGIDPAVKKAVSLRLKSVNKRKNGTLWIRYKVIGIK